MRDSLSRMDNPGDLPADGDGGSRHPAIGVEKFCSRCGGELTLKPEGGRLRPWCAACGHVVFGRFSVGVGGLLRHGDRVLLVQRGKDPGKGRWTFPGGYAEEDEPPHAALAREVFEETGLRVAAGEAVAIRFAQTAGDQNLYCVFSLRLTGAISDLRPDGDGDEVSAVTLIEPARLPSLGEVGGVTRWVIEHVPASARGLSIRQSGFPVVPFHKWSVLLVPADVTTYG
jgi:ADP-ribose pyrophosphatase YjhB (NUDIX family)